MKAKQAIILNASILLIGLGGAGNAGASADAQGEVDAQTPVAQQGDGDSGSTSKPRFASARPGWYLALAPSSTRIDIADADRPGDGLMIEEKGGGLKMLLGYAFTRTFAVELSILGSVHETDQPEIEAGFGQVQLDVVTQLVEYGRWQPYLAGGIGYAAFAVRGSTIANSSISGGQVDFGGGLEFNMSRHFALALDYRYSIQRFQEKEFELDPNTSTKVAIDSAGSASVWGLRLAYSF